MHRVVRQDCFSLGEIYYCKDFQKRKETFLFYVIFAQESARLLESIYVTNHKHNSESYFTTMLTYYSEYAVSPFNEQDKQACSCTMHPIFVTLENNDLFTSYTRHN